MISGNLLQLEYIYWIFCNKAQAKHEYKNRDLFNIKSL